MEYNAYIPILYNHISIVFSIHIMQTFLHINSVKNLLLITVIFL